MKSLNSIPELRALTAPTSVVRIPYQQQVPLTDRVRRLIDASPLQRLRNIKQLGLVSLVYPGATHSRFEHCLGAYHNSLLFLRQLALDDAFANTVDDHAAESLIAAALLHDVGHWPFCHPIEDMGLVDVPRHESLCRERLENSNLSHLLQTDWGLTAKSVADLIDGTAPDHTGRILSSILSGPIDVDKMDYLQRDSLHAGVPYGMHFDSQRLIASVCLNAQDGKLALTEKGRTAAELMVFARYVMFSEVYWHHAVRSATAMLQRAFFELHEAPKADRFWNMHDVEWVEAISHAAESAKCSPAKSLLESLFGPQRRLYKRLGQFAHFDDQAIYDKLARRPYSWLVACGHRLADIIRHEAGVKLSSPGVLIDAPPMGLEVQFNIQVRDSRDFSFRPLADLSPVVRVLATHQFDDYVKRVRVFIEPTCDEVTALQPHLRKWLETAIEDTESTL
ncbi:MAG TPA: HD domain-containing protein [Pirellulaceae bacterium]|nr:HD domain-containing protein [Pirellulaceae bacterium]HMO90728.1 HD domain-containing protein [Pirellulaceae bacterium]HMP67979.1 HD domain-containing protein [Pirellulaceae bacterium]